jgi:serine protease
VILPPEDRADIINLSLGGLLSAPDRLQQSVIDDVRAQGVIVVASAGNRASSAELYPASYQGVVSVSATGREAQIAAYSSFGPNVDVAAPGGADDFLVVSTWGGEGYAPLRGTSMASPHVAGVVALMQSVRIADGKDRLTPEQFDFLLANGDLTRDLGAEGRDDLYGYGLIDAARAVAAARSDPEPTPILSVIPDEIEFGETVSAAALNIRNLGGGSLAVSVSLSLGDSWLNIEADDSVSADGLGVYTLRVNRAGLALGSYMAEVRVTPTEFGETAIQEIVIPVSMTVGSNSFGGDVGEIFMFLVDTARPNEIRGELPLPVVDALSGAYEFKDVPAGCYFVYASTDIDADLFFAELGEAWNFWFGTATEAESAGVLELDSDKQDINFNVSFD